MKKILLLLLISLPAFAQDGFKVENGKIVWQRSFNKHDDIAGMLINKEGFKMDSVSDNYYKGTAVNVKNTCSSGSVLMKYDTRFDFVIFVTADNYVVKIMDFNFLERYGPMQARIVPTSLEKYYLEYGKIRQSEKTQTDIACVDSFLSEVFVPGAEPSPQDNPELTLN